MNSFIIMIEKHLKISHKLKIILWKSIHLTSKKNNWILFSLVASASFIQCERSRRIYFNFYIRGRKNTQKIVWPYNRKRQWPWYRYKKVKSQCTGYKLAETVFETWTKESYSHFTTDEYIFFECTWNCQQGEKKKSYNWILACNNSDSDFYAFSCVFMAVAMRHACSSLSNFCISLCIVKNMTADKCETHINNQTLGKWLNVSLIQNCIQPKTRITTNINFVSKTVNFDRFISIWYFVAIHIVCDMLRSKWCRNGNDWIFDGTHIQHWYY